MELPKTASGWGRPARWSAAALDFVGGHVDNLAGDQTVFHAHLGRQNALIGNAKIAHALGDHPAIGGADRPKLDSGLLHPRYQFEEFLKDVLAHELVHIAGRGVAQLRIAQAGVELHHLRAHRHFTHVAGAVIAIARIDPVVRRARDQPLLQGPGHESVTGVAAPQRSVAIEDRNLRLALENQALKLFSCPFANFDMCRRQSFLSRASKNSSYSIFIEIAGNCTRPSGY